MPNERGNFIVVYGPNNIGKTTQVKKTVDWLSEKGINASYLKYPVYGLVPTGPRLNRILREKSEQLSPLEIQKIFAQNRRDYEPTLLEKLNRGEWVVAEDYKGTGIAWGMTYDIELAVLEKINKGLLDEDLALCMIGERFESGIEKGHLHEEGGRWEKNKKIHEMLAKRKNWVVVDANGSIDAVNARIRKAISQKFFNE